MKKYRYCIVSVTDKRTFDKGLIGIETDEDDIKKINLPDDVDYVYKLGQNPKSDGYFSFIGHPESELKRIIALHDIDSVYKLGHDPKSNGSFFFIGYPASITDVENEFERIKALPDSHKYINYLKHLNEIVVDCKKDYTNELIIYKTQNGILNYGSKKAGILVSPTIFAENDSNNEQLDDNKDRFYDNKDRFYDKSYIDLE